MVLRVVLILLLVGLIVWALGTRSRTRRRSEQVPRPQEFARCAHCGVHLPINEAVRDGDRAYCSEAHRLAGPMAGR